MAKVENRVTVQIGPQYLAALLAGPAVDALEQVLSRADRRAQPSADYWVQLYTQFGVAQPAAGPAVAALRRLGEGGIGDGRVWMCLDPIHATPNREHLVVLPPQQLAVTAAEATALVAELNAHFVADSLHMEMFSPGRWYATLPVAANIATTPLLEAVGRNIRDVLPRGEGARQWARLWNEMQMVLHGSPVNQARESSRQLTVNSLWAWGEGALPELNRRLFDVCVTDEPYARGLAIAAGARWLAPEAALGEVDLGARALWVLESDHTHSVDPASLATDCQGVFTSLLRRLAKNQLGLLEVVIAGQRYQLTRGGLRKFWRRRLPLRDLCG